MSLMLPHTPLKCPLSFTIILVRPLLLYSLLLEFCGLLSLKDILSLLFFCVLRSHGVKIAALLPRHKRWIKGEVASPENFKGLLFLTLSHFQDLSNWLPLELSRTTNLRDWLNNKVLELYEAFYVVLQASLRVIPESKGNC